ncbi:MAG TPA: hypothetical protein VN690_07605 [Terriglobales bacterium]|nr:hypothetical protein [Terriglobales bacterium]
MPLPLGHGLGCALLPGSIAVASLAVRGATLTGNATGRPASLDWQARGHAAEVRYSANTVTETVDGKPVLSASFASIAPATFADSEFTLPPLPARARRAGGGQ